MSRILISNTGVFIFVQKMTRFNLVTFAFKHHNPLSFHLADRLPLLAIKFLYVD